MAPFKSPYGNGPRDIPSAGPGMTLADLQTSSAIPTNVKVKMTAGPQPGPAPAPTGPAPTPAPAPQDAAPGPGGLSAGEAAALSDYDKMSPEERQALSDSGGAEAPLSAEGGPAQPGMLSRMKEHVRKHWGELAGGTIGGLAAGSAGPVALAAGAGVGASMGEKFQAYLDGKEQPDLADSLMTGGKNAAGALIGGAAAGFLGSGGGLARVAGSDAASMAAAQHAADVAAPIVGQAASMGIPVGSYQTAPGTIMGANARQAATEVAMGQRGIRPQQELVDLQLAQDAAMQGKLQQMKDIFPAVYGRRAATGEKLGHIDTELKSHEFSQQWLDNFHGKLDTYKGIARETFGDRQFDIQPLIGDIEVALKRNFIIDDQGRPLPGQKLAGDELQLFNLWKSLGRATTRQTAFGARNQQIPGMVDSGNGPWMAQGQGGTLAGPPSGMPELNMRRMPDMQPGQVPIKISMLPPNEAGASTAGVNFDSLDNIVSRIQNLSASAKRGDSAMKGNWDDLSKSATTAYHDVLRENLAPVNPEAANMIARLNSMYSGYVDGVRDLNAQIKSAPSSAARVFVDKAEPANTKEAFHILSEEQGNVVRREIMLDAFRKSWSAADGKASAKLMADELRSYGDENLGTVLRGEKEQVFKALDAMTQLQRTQISPGAAERMLDNLEVSASKSALVRQGVGIWKSFFNKNKPLQEYLGSADFLDKISRRSALKNATERSADFTSKYLLNGGTSSGVGNAAGVLLSSPNDERQQAQ